MTTPLPGLVDEELEADALWGKVRREPKRMEEMQKELDRLSQCPRCSEGNRKTNP